MKDREYKDAWEKLKDKLLRDYPTVEHLADVSNGDGERGELSKHEDILRHMDQLDNTNEFSNLLSDLEGE
ncbi:hypothetical protein QI301_12285 [Staphylococcus saprophyticus]|uniref:hypothetical protein n=1 Tax=Staphylococcus saprophyticus TaxID=29385 RepID=UPI00085310AB|nr:hypothetical protein [Staphylococcus saprophyticus]MDW3871231.1 hypothetical protein [Staphylococcus saprophyticus]MDW4026263.1 hypothetical protein [Staphylococcus saprophyticus]OEK40151.1 hypothetical protein ASS89_08660 [Staphylococcus saprophyticus]